MGKRKSAKLLMAVVSLLLISCGYTSQPENVSTLYEKRGTILQHLAWQPEQEQFIFLPDIGEPFKVLSATGEEVREFAFPTDRVTGLSTLFWLDETTLIYTRQPPNPKFGTLPTQLIKYDITNEIEVVLQEDKRFYDGCAISPHTVVLIEGDLRYSLLYGNLIRVYDLETMLPIIEFNRGFKQDILAIACDPLREEIIILEQSGYSSRSETYTIYTIHIPSSKSNEIYDSDGMRLGELTVSPDGEWIAVVNLVGKESAPRNGLLLISADGKIVHELQSPSFDSIIEIEWSPINDNLLVSKRAGFRSASLELYDLTTWLSD